MFSLVSDGFDTFKPLFGPVWIGIHQVSAQMVDSQLESWHFCKSAPGYWGGGPLSESSRCRQELGPVRNLVQFRAQSHILESGPANSLQVRPSNCGTGSIFCFIIPSCFFGTSFQFSGFVYSLVFSSPQAFKRQNQTKNNRRNVIRTRNRCIPRMGYILWYVSIWTYCVPSSSDAFIII